MSALDELKTMTPSEMRKALKARGIDSEIMTYPNPNATGVRWKTNDITWDYDWYGDTPQALSTHMFLSPQDAIDATSPRNCATCPETDNPDSYISHLQSALKWHDEHVPMPTNPRNTCVVLCGEKPPEEVLFVGPDGVTHYLPEGAETCESIVRCKDCRNYQEPCPENGWNGMCDYADMPMTDTGFCSWAERREMSE